MKKLLTVLSFMIALSSLNAQFIKFNSRDVIFIKSLVAETRFKQIMLTNQSSWQLSRPTTFVNLSEIFIVLNEESYGRTNSGVAFINGQEYDINYLGGPFFYEAGFLFKVINMHYDGGRIMLDDYSEWDIAADEDKENIAKWFIPKFVVMDKSKKYLIDPQSQNKIYIKLVE